MITTKKIAGIAIASMILSGSCGGKLKGLNPKDERPFAKEQRIEKGTDRPDTGGDPFCRRFPEIEAWAGRRGIDPLFVRALIAIESGFDTCKATMASERGSTAGRSKEGFELKADPLKKAGGPYGCGFDKENFDIEGVDPLIRRMDLGLMQVPIEPEIFLEGREKGARTRNAFSPRREYGAVSDRLRKIASGCDESFDPFVPDHNICAGTMILRYSLDEAGKWIDSHPGIVGEDEDAGAVTEYIAAHIYHGDWDHWDHSALDPACPDKEGLPGNSGCLAYGYSISRTDGGMPCASEDGFVGYASCMISLRGQGQMDHGLRVLEMKDTLQSNCRNNGVRKQGDESWRRSRLASFAENRGIGEKG